MNLNFLGLVSTQGIENAESRTRGSSQLFQANRSSRTFQNTRTNYLYLFALTLILSSQCYLFLTAIFVYCSSFIVVEHKRLAAAQDLDSLFRKGLIAFTQVSDTTIRPIRETYIDKNRVGVNCTFIPRTNALSKYPDRRRSRYEFHQVNEVTNLTDNSSATLFWILRPVFFWNPSSVYPIKN